MFNACIGLPREYTCDKMKCVHVKEYSHSSWNLKDNTHTQKSHIPKTTKRKFKVSNNKTYLLTKKSYK